MQQNSLNSSNLVRLGNGSTVDMPTLDMKALNVDDIKLNVPKEWNTLKN